MIFFSFSETSGCFVLVLAVQMDGFVLLCEMTCLSQVNGLEYLSVFLKIIFEVLAEVIKFSERKIDYNLE